jgi:dynactin 1
MTEQLQVGQVIELTDGRLATVRYIGQPHFAGGDWVGVELEDESGKNDGSVQGERYFECDMGRGMFVRPAAVTIIEQAPAPKPAAVPAKKAARPSSVVGSGIGRRMSAVPDVGAGKRMSMNSASPTPSSRSRPSSLLRVRPIKSSCSLLC